MKLIPFQSTEQTSLLNRFGRSLIWLAILFSFPLVQWVRFACKSEFHSHVLLVPFVSAYLIRIAALDGLWQPSPRSHGTKTWVCLWSLLALGNAVAYVLSVTRGFPLPGSDALALSSLSLLFGVYALACWHFSGKSLREITFPLAFLLFSVPLPALAMDAIEVILQHASAEVACWFFNLTALPFLRDQLTFTLPGITIKVAQECSGVRSSLVLFMTSLIAGYMFLRRSNHRILLTLFTVVLGVFRNAFRILVIAWLCVEVGPEMIHSVIHKRGGPIFFVLSLLPLGLVLWILVRRERKTSSQLKGSAPTSLIAVNGRTKTERA